VGEGSRNLGVKRIEIPGSGHFLSGLVGRFPVMGQAGRNCFGKQTLKKGRFFYSIAGFWIVFI
jgi:hypothetical protein